MSGNPWRRLCERIATVCFAASALAACGPKSQVALLGHTGPLAEPFAVSEFFSPSGHMGDGAVPGPLTLDIDENCKDRPPGARGDCYRFTYVPSTQLWAGVYWQYPSNNWGTEHGWPVAQRADEAGVLPVFTTVKFMAASNVPADASGNALSVQFIVGGINGGFAFSDDFKFSTFKTDISTEWKAYSIDISGVPFSSVIGAFCWVTSYPSGSDPQALPAHVLYLDDIVWE